MCRQVYALWHTLQRRDFKYSSVSNSSLSSNVVYSQRVRTISDALGASQINCVDGSVLFASLLRAINIDPCSSAFRATCLWVFILTAIIARCSVWKPP